jgi:hypothetical protein
MKSISTIINKDIDLVQNSTSLKTLENEYEDIRKKLVKIEYDKTTPEYHWLFNQLENTCNKIDVILRS